MPTAFYSILLYTREEQSSMVKLRIIILIFIAADNESVEINTIFICQATVTACVF